MKLLIVCLTILELRLLHCSYTEQFHLTWKTKRRLQTGYFYSFLKAFQGYHLILHVDNKTLKINRDLLITSMILYNHESMAALQRPCAGQYINIVALNDINMFSKYVERDNNVLPGDVYAFLHYDQELQSNVKWENKFIEKAGTVFIINILQSTVQVYKICYYCGLFSKKLILIQTTNLTRKSKN